LRFARFSRKDGFKLKIIRNNGKPVGATSKTDTSILDFQKMIKIN
jgi:hypothetical protein